MSQPPIMTSTSEAEEWTEIGPRSKAIQSRHHSNTFISPITQIFGGRLRSTVRATGSKDSVTSEPFQSLQLDITVPTFFLFFIIIKRLCVFADKVGYE